MAVPYDWWKNKDHPFGSDELNIGFNEIKKLEEDNRNKMIMMSTPTSDKSEFEKMLRNDAIESMRSAVSDRVASASNQSLSYDDLRKAHESMLDRNYNKHIRIPVIEGDSEARKTIKRNIRVKASRHITAENPYGDTVRLDGEFVLKARTDFHERPINHHESRYEDLVMAMENEILSLARDIVRTRKGMI